MATKNETKHASTDIMLAVSTAHGTTDAALVARTEAVASALAAGVTVKALAADMREAAERGVKGITPVAQSTLGFSTGVLAVLDKLGVSLETAVKGNPGMIADTYRAIMRQGKAPVLKAVAGAVDAGKTPAAKLRAARGTASELVDAAIAARKTTAGKPRTTTKAAGTETYAGILARMASGIASGAYVPDADFVKALNALAAEVKRATGPAPAPRPAPAKVAAKVAA